MAQQVAAEREKAAKAFVKQRSGRDYEKGDTGSCWLELLRDVVGMETVTMNVRFESSTSGRGYVDVAIRDANTIAHLFELYTKATEAAK